MLECILLEEKACFHAKENMGKLKLHDKCDRSSKTGKEKPAAAPDFPAKLCSNSMKRRGGVDK